MKDHPLKKYFPAPDEIRDAWLNDYDSGMPREAEYCQHGNCPDDGCDKCASAAQWFDEKALQEENAGGEDVREMSRVHVPASSSAPLLQLDYPVWRLSFSEYGNQNGWEVPS